MKGATTGILHAKYWVLDETSVFMGSQNFDWRALTEIHETGVYIQDNPGLAAEYLRVFAIDWQVAGAPDAENRKLAAKKAVTLSRKTAPRAATMPGDVELVASPPSLNPAGMRAAGDALVEILDRAKSKIRVQLLYYAPFNKYAPKERTPYWPRLDNALRSAQARGVKVELLVSHWNLRQPDYFHLKSLAVLPGVDVRIATIPESKRLGDVPYSRVAHSKYMTVDDRLLWIGTSNWGEDYFEESRNLELILKRPDLTAQANGIFDRLWGSPLTKSVLEHLPTEKKVH